MTSPTKESAIASPPPSLPRPASVYVFPFPLPTWNRVLAMRLQHRLALKRAMKELCSISIRSGTGSPIQMGSAPSGSSTALLMQKYLLMIRPKTSKK